MYSIGLVAALFWGVGTNVLHTGVYPVHGISIGDIVFSLWLILAVMVRYERRLFAAAIDRTRLHLVLVSAFVTSLLVSTTVNSLRFSAGFSDIFAILRMFYFSTLMIFTAAFVRKYGSRGLMLAFLVGILLLGIEQVGAAVSRDQQVLVSGFLVLPDANVIGNMLGIGAVLCSLAILWGMVAPALGFLIAFSVLSVMTFSKGTWLMIGLSFVANAVALVIALPAISSRRRIQMFRLATVAGVVLVTALTMYFSQLMALMQFKLASTEAGETLAARIDFARAAIYAMADYPLLGLGLRNFAETYTLYPGLQPDRAENAHNAFLQIAAVGGVPALTVFLILFAYPFVLMYKIVPSTALLRVLYVSVVGLVFIVSGSQQLQLVFQPFFWFFTGLIVGTRWRQRESEAPLRRLGRTG
jgi:O-antigen ligase